MVSAFTDANFEAEVIKSNKLSVISFWAEWSGPCKTINSIIEELAKDYEGKINAGKTHVDQNPQVSIEYGITSIPAVLFFKGEK